MAAEKISFDLHSLWSKLRNSRFVRDVLMLSGGTGLAQIIAVAVLPVLTRLYSPHDFGVLTLFISIVVLLTAFTTFNYELMIMLSKSHRSASQLVWLILALSSVVASIALFVVALVHQRLADIFGMPELSAPLYAVPPLIIFTTLYQALRYWKMRLMQFTIVARSMIVRALTFAVCAPFFAFIPFGMNRAQCLIAAVAGSEIFKTLVRTESIRKAKVTELAPARRIRMSVVARRHGPLALTRSVSTGMSLIYDRVPDLIISSFFGAATLGLYGMVERIVAAPSRLVSGAIGDVYRQRASVLHRTEGRFDQLTLRTIGATALISFVPFLIAILSAPKLAPSILGPDWAAAGHYASILLVGEFVAFITTPIDDAVLIVGAKRFVFFWSLARLLLTLSLFPLAQFGILNFTQFLWGLVTVRITMVGIYGAAALQYSRTGCSELVKPIWLRSAMKPPAKGRDSCNFSRGFPSDKKQIKSQDLSTET